MLDGCIPPLGDGERVRGGPSDGLELLTPRFPFVRVGGGKMCGCGDGALAAAGADGVGLAWMIFSRRFAMSNGSVYGYDMSFAKFIP